MKPETLAVHAGRRSGGAGARESLSPPLEQASVQVFRDLDELDAVAAGRRAGHLYARNSNENVDALAAAVAALEGAEAGVAAGSGMAALLVTVLSLAPRPARVAVAADVYGVSLSMLRQDLEPLGYTVRTFDAASGDGLESALDGAAVALCETISNPLSRVADLPGICAAATRAGVPLVVDNTYATPIHCRPLDHGATVVYHSVTKYIGGHSDLVAGAVAGPEPLMAEIRARTVRLGTTLGPFEAWLALRGLRTLAVRMRRASATSVLLAEGLAGLPGVNAVHHPLVSGSPESQRARAILDGGAGGMFAFDLAGGRAAVQRMLERLRLVVFAASFGGVETTISHPDLASHRTIPEPERRAAGITAGTVRVSTGLEDPEDLLADFRQAIA